MIARFSEYSVKNRKKNNYKKKISIQKQNPIYLMVSKNDIGNTSGNASFFLSLSIFFLSLPLFGEAFRDTRSPKLIVS